jgi:predicted amidohydrolase YtcJ
MRALLQAASSIPSSYASPFLNLGEEPRIAVQNRMAFQGEFFVDRYGKEQAKRTPPIRGMLELGEPIGAGTDATRVSSYNPYLSLYWLITGRTIGDLRLYPEENRFDRGEALKLYTIGSSWFSTEDGKKGAIAPGATCRLGNSLRRLFLHSGRRDQTQA